MKIVITIDIQPGPNDVVSVNPSVPPAPPPAPPPVEPPAPPPPPPAPPPVPPVEPMGSFLWSQTGMVLPVYLTEGAVHSFAVDVPAGYQGTLSGKLFQASYDTIEYHRARVWFSIAPGGAPFVDGRGTVVEYDDVAGQGVVTTPEFWPAPGMTSRRLYLNVMSRDQRGRMNVMLNHQ